MSDTGVDTQGAEDDSVDSVLAELRSLREGRGLSADRVADCPHLLSALGTSDPGEACDTLRVIIRRMGDDEHGKALRVDFGMDLDELLQRAPVSRERDFVGDRRSAYSQVAHRSVKTLSRWSDRTTAELRGQLITDQFSGQLVVAAGVQHRRITGIEVLRYEASDTDMRTGRSTGYQNPEDSSLPLLLYGFPRDWAPISIRFVVAFLGEDYPARAWAIACDSVLDVSFGHERYPIEIDEGMARCRIDRPRRDQLYGVWWEWSRDDLSMPTDPPAETVRRPLNNPWS